MTDFSSKLVVYYNVNLYNNTAAAIPAHYIKSLDFPLVNKASEYSVAVVKAKFDIALMVPTPAPVGAQRYDKIIIQSASLSVIGSVYGNNLQNQTIMDVDFRQDSPISPLYYQPLFPQPLTLSSPLPIQMIDIRVRSQFEDGTQEDFMIPPKTNWTCRLAFIRR